MNEKVQQILNKVDEVTEKCNIIPAFLDKVVDFMKKPSIACIPEVLNKITSRFSLVAVALFAVVYIVNCLKNAVVSCCFESGPYKMAFGLAIAAVINTALIIYIIYKTMGIFDNIVAASQCKISSLNIFSIMTFGSQILAVFSLLGGIYGAIECKDFMMFVYGVIGAMFFFLMALYNSTPENFAIVQDKNASAGEDFTALTTFAVKVVLRLVPIMI
ncbi:MAG: hypothetical protein J6S19_07160, partial [Lentisphaeria bacterium]|nr:hypothetical protein [Lentisphaeria bacterium]